MDESLLLALYTADVMRKIDEIAIKGLGIPGGHLMERAGVGVAGEILERYEPEEAVVFAGKGNNGGDGFVVARELFDAGVEVTVFTLAPAGAYEGDAKLNLDILGRLGVDVREAFAEDAPADEVVMLTEMADVVVDAIFGTGFTGAAKGAAAEIIGLIDEAPGAVVSVDVASGVGASSGVVNGPAVMADLTVALHAAKVGHFVTPGGVFSGEVVVVPIGIPALCDHETDVWLLSEEALGELVVSKGALDHKRSVGTLLVVGGSKGMTGAAHMTAMAALRSGAGLVHAAFPEGSHGPKPFPEVITIEVPGEDGQFAEAARTALLDEAAGLKAVAVGPGLGRADEAQKLVRELVGVDRPLLLDADGLYALGDKPELVLGGVRYAPGTYDQWAIVPLMGGRGRAGPPARPAGRGGGGPPPRVRPLRRPAQRRDRAAQGRGQHRRRPVGPLLRHPHRQPGARDARHRRRPQRRHCRPARQGSGRHRRGLPRRLPARPRRRPRRGERGGHRRHGRQRPVPVPAGRRGAAQGRPTGGDACPRLNRQPRERPSRATS